jgi:hypothetical protein
MFLPGTNGSSLKVKSPDRLEFSSCLDDAWMCDFLLLEGILLGVSSNYFFVYSRGTSTSIKLLYYSK